MALAGKQLAFVKEYLVDMNATQAAIRAGYSAASAYSQGSRLLKNDEVLQEIRARIMGEDEIKLRLTDIARGDIADLMALTPGGFTFELAIKDENGNWVPNPKTKLIKKIKQKVTTYSARKEDGEDREIIETEIELYPALDALRDLGKVHKIFTEKHETEVTLRPDDAFTRALERIYGTDSGA